MILDATGRPMQETLTDYGAQVLEALVEAEEITRGQMERIDELNDRCELVIRLARMYRWRLRRLLALYDLDEEAVTA